MNEERQAILRMLAEGKISVEEAEMLLDALGDTSEKQEEAKAQRDSQRKCSDPFFGDFKFKFDFGDCTKFDFSDFAKTFDHFGETFSRRFEGACGDFFSKKGSPRF